MILARQNLPVLDRGPGAYAAADGAAHGGYVLAGADEDADVLLIATGSEVQIALDARDLLAGEGITARVVSMPCREWFAQQPASYRDEVLPPSVRARDSVEAGIGQGWRDIVGHAGRIICLEHFGASADYQRLYREFGITAEAVAQQPGTASPQLPARSAPAGTSRPPPRRREAPATSPSDARPV